MLAGLAGLAAVGHERVKLGPTDGAGWHPIAWPFPRDGWPPGRGWRRDTTDVYVRPKLGFCGNCETGVVTDDEVDRVTDIDLLDERFQAVRAEAGSASPTLVGRARLYKYKLKNGAQRYAEGIAVAYKCDLVVAIVVGNVADERERKAAHRLLESNTVQVWVNQQLEGR